MRASSIHFIIAFAICATPIAAQTVFAPPYSKSGAPLAQPLVLKIGTGTGSTAQAATSAVATGIVTFDIDATAKAGRGMLALRTGTG
jgi:predicted RNA methylase